MDSKFWILTISCLFATFHDQIIAQIVYCVYYDESHVLSTTENTTKNFYTCSLHTEQSDYFFDGHLDIHGDHLSGKDDQHVSDLGVANGNRLRNFTSDLCDKFGNLEIFSIFDSHTESVDENALRNCQNLMIFQLIGNNIQELPENLFATTSNLEVIFIRNNKELTKLPQNIFLNQKLLENLDLSGNGLNFLPKDIFSSLENIRLLELSNNRLEAFATNWFQNTHNLIELSMHNNQLWKLPSEVFKPLHKLEKLHLHQNKIGFLDANCFEGLQNLQILTLWGNAILDLPEDIFKPLENLRIFSLGSNKLSVIDSGSFGVHSQLMEVYFQDNSITAIDEKFIDNTAVTTLDVTGNLCCSEDFEERNDIKKHLKKCFENYQAKTVVEHQTVEYSEPSLTQTTENSTFQASAELSTSTTLEVTDPEFIDATEIHTTQHTSRVTRETTQAIISRTTFTKFQPTNSPTRISVIDIPKVYKQIPRPSKYFLPPKEEFSFNLPQENIQQQIMEVIETTAFPEITSYMEIGTRSKQEDENGGIFNLTDGNEATTAFTLESAEVGYENSTIKKEDEVEDTTIGYEKQHSEIESSTHFEPIIITEKFSVFQESTAVPITSVLNLFEAIDLSKNESLATIDNPTTTLEISPTTSTESAVPEIDYISTQGPTTFQTFKTKFTQTTSPDTTTSEPMHLVNAKLPQSILDLLKTVPTTRNPAVKHAGRKSQFSLPSVNVLPPKEVPITRNTAVKYRGHRVPHLSLDILPPKEVLMEVLTTTTDAPTETTVQSIAETSTSSAAIKEETVTESSIIAETTNEYLKDGQESTSTDSLSPKEVPASRNTALNYPSLQVPHLSLDILPPKEATLVEVLEKTTETTVHSIPETSSAAIEDETTTESFILAETTTDNLISEQESSTTEDSFRTSKIAKEIVIPWIFLVPPELPVVEKSDEKVNLNHTFSEMPEINQNLSTEVYEDTTESITTYKLEETTENLEEIIEEAYEPGTCGQARKSSGVYGLFPWTVFLVNQNGTKLCGGTLVSNRKVITAAHCIRNKSSTVALSPPDIFIHLKTKNIENYFRIRKIHLHEDWSIQTVAYDADIAVLELENSVTFTNLIHPICLIMPNSKVINTTQGFISGYSETANESKVLEMQVHNNSNCFVKNEKLRLISSGRTFCAGTLNFGEACAWDSGSGLFVQQDDIYYLRGISSHKSAGCGLSDEFGIFADMIKFSKWVESVMVDEIIDVK